MIEDSTLIVVALVVLAVVGLAIRASFVDESKQRPLIQQLHCLWAF